MSTREIDSRIRHARMPDAQQYLRTPGTSGTPGTRYQLQEPQEPQELLEPQVPRFCRTSRRRSSSMAVLWREKAHWDEIWEETIRLESTCDSKSRGAPAVCGRYCREHRAPSDQPVSSRRCALSRRHGRGGLSSTQPGGIVRLLVFAATAACRRRAIVADRRRHACRRRGDSHRVTQQHSR